MTTEQVFADHTESIAPVREFTVRGVALGLVLALTLGAANAYLGLYAGLTVSASIPAAVISMAILRMAGGTTILENNFVQAIASAGEAVAAGSIFTFPALIILGHRGPLPYLEVTALSAAGGTMGSLLVVFLRRAYIVEEKLPFPEGVACAEVLRAGENRAHLGPMLWGGVLSGALKAAQDIVGIIPGILSRAVWIGRVPLAGSINISAALLGIGYIVGLQTAALVFAGGAFAWLVAIPGLAVVHGASPNAAAAQAASTLWSGEVRYLGVGAMITGGIVTLWRLRIRIFAALRDSMRAVRSGHVPKTAREDTDISSQNIAVAVGLTIPVVFVLCLMIGASVIVSLGLAIVLAVIAFFASGIAGYLSGIVGASNNPVSGVTVIVLLAIALFLKFAGIESIGVGPRLSILAGAVVCTAAAMAGDSLHDLATGYFVGATPRALEIGILLGALAASLSMAPILNLLIAAYGIAGTATAHTGALAAPQAFLMAKVTQGVFSGGLPWKIVFAGVLLAALLAVTDTIAEKAGWSWRTPIMPVAIGLYLPMGLSVTIFLGALLSRWLGKSEEGGPKLLFAAGMVAGEALMGVATGALVTVGVKLPII